MAIASRLDTAGTTYESKSMGRLRQRVKSMGEKKQEQNGGFHGESTTRKGGFSEKSPIKIVFEWLFKQPEMVISGIHPIKIVHEW